MHKLVLTLLTVTVLCPIAFCSPEKACVIIKTGDGGSGTGFILKKNDNFFMVTNQHVISGPPPHKYVKRDGTELRPLKGLVARDRDLVIFKLGADQEHFLELEADVRNVALGSNLVIYGNAHGEGMRLSRAELVKITNIEIEVSDGIVPGNSGGPILNEKTGKVVGVSTFITAFGEPKSLDEAMENAGLPKIRFYGVRIDSVNEIDAFDLREFINETAAIKANNERMKWGITLICMLHRMFGDELTDEGLHYLTLADNHHRRLFGILTPSSLRPGEMHHKKVRDFATTGVKAFNMGPLPKYYIHKVEYLNQRPQMDYLREYFKTLVREIATY